MSQYRRAKNYLVWQAAFRDRLNATLEPVTAHMGLCGKDGRRHHWSVEVTEWLFVPCPCCLAIRFFILGLIAGASVAAIIAIIL